MDNSFATRVITRVSKNCLGGGTYHTPESIHPFSELVGTFAIHDRVFEAGPNTRVFSEALCQSAETLMPNGHWSLFSSNLRDDIYAARKDGDWVMFIAPIKAIKCTFCGKVKLVDDASRMEAVVPLCQGCDEIVHQLADPSSSASIFLKQRGWIKK